MQLLIMQFSPTSGHPSPLGPNGKHHAQAASAPRKESSGPTDDNEDDDNNSNNKKQLPFQLNGEFE
jgi:hypothetical protein